MYLPMSSILFKKELTRLLFDETLAGYEDYWWLHQAFVQGFVVQQMKDPLIYIDTDLKRSANRSSESDSIFMGKLREISPRLARNFLASHSIRAKIYTGDIKGVLQTRKAAKTLYVNYFLDSFEFLWQLPITILFFVLYSLREYIE